MDPVTDASVPAIDDSASPAATGTGTPPARSNQQWKARIAKCRRYKRNLIEDWRTNIDFRRGKVFQSDSDEDRIAVAYDWSATKAKQASLFSQIPQIRLRAKSEAYRPGVPVFARKVNDELTRAEVGTAMDECLPDCINAAGYALVMVAFETRSENRDISVVAAPPASPLAPGAIPPPAAPPALGPDGQPAPPAPATEPVPYTTAKRIIIDRLSPSDGLWDLSFAGSNFNRSPWVGRTGRMHWSRAKSEFGLTDDEKADVCTTGSKSYYDKLTNTEEQDLQNDMEMVEFDEIFYWRYLFHDDEPSFEAIQRIVFVRGKNEPISEQWKGQKRQDANGNPAEMGEVILGSCKFPLQFVTLTYITDEAIPPSDSAMARPQVEELMQGRTDMLLQRRYSRPLRWFNNNMVAPEMVTALMRGTWNGMIPMNGPGDRAVGEVARANYPREDFEFDRVAKTELDNTFQIGGSQGNGGGSNTQIRTAAEANNAQSNMQTRVGYERARVVKFFCNIAEVVAGLISLYGDWTPEEQQALQGLDLKRLPSYYTYSVRADASVLLSAADRYQRLEAFWNLTAKSGLVDEVPILQEMAALIDVDETIIKQPAAKAPEPANVSLRVDAESLKDPMFIAMLLATGQMFTPEQLDAAKKIILASTALPQPPAPPAPGGPEALPNGTLPNGATPPEPVNPDLNMADRVNKRVENGR